MIRLYWISNSGNKLYYNKETAIFEAKNTATEFNNIFEINTLVKGIGTYHDLTNLGTEHIYYKIYIQEFTLDCIWSTSKEAERVCEKLNEGLNKQVFKVQEIVYDELNQSMII